MSIGDRLPNTLSQAFLRTAQRHRDIVAVRTIDDCVSLTWGALWERVESVAAGFHQLGLRRGDTIALMLTNRPEFAIADLAAICLGLTPFSIYQTLPPSQILPLLLNSQARLIVCESIYLQRLLTVSKQAPLVTGIVTIDGTGSGGTIDWAQLSQTSATVDIASLAQSVEPDAVATIIYTSGTTGPPKGVELTHRNIIGALQARAHQGSIEPGDRLISWLPTAHVGGRLGCYYQAVYAGGTTTYCSDPSRIIEWLPQIRPHSFFAVPRIWEKLKALFEVQLGLLPKIDQEEAANAIELAKTVVRNEQTGEIIAPDIAERIARADARFFKPIRQRLGLADALSLYSGGASAPLHVLEFLHAVGIAVGEVWGMSETGATVTANPRGRMRLGTVGLAEPGYSVQLAADGEILVRGPSVMARYRNDPDRTAEAFDPNGWLRTGDIGVFDCDGYLRIIDRKKELIINSSGKNMSPANIEATLKATGPLIGQVTVIGDGRPYNVALIILDTDRAPLWAETHGLGARRTIADLAGEPAVRVAMQAQVDAANDLLSRVEQIKSFAILPAEWLPAGDELTPTMKLKRRSIAEKYAPQITDLYENSGQARANT